MKALLPTVLACVLLVAAPAAAGDGPVAPDNHAGPRIVWGQHGEVEHAFDSRGPLRRSNASTRQAYFGSGEEYSDTLARLRAQLDRMTARERLVGLELSPAQEAAREDMPPALLRALGLSQRARQDLADD